MLTTHVVVGAVDRPLQLGEVVLGLVGARSRRPVVVLAQPVVDRVMLDEATAEGRLLDSRVGVQNRIVPIDVVGDNRLQGAALDVRNHP